MKIKEKVPYITKTIFYFYIFIKMALKIFFLSDYYPIPHQ